MQFVVYGTRSYVGSLFSFQSSLNFVAREVVFQGIELGIGVSHNGSVSVNDGNAESCVVGCSFSNQLVYGLKEIPLILGLGQLVVLDNLFNGIGKGSEIFLCLGNCSLLQGVEADNNKEHKTTTKS